MSSAYYSTVLFNTTVLMDLHQFLPDTWLRGCIVIRSSGETVCDVGLGAVFRWLRNEFCIVISRVVEIIRVLISA